MLNDVFFTKLSKVPLSRLVRGNQRMGRRQKQGSRGNSAIDTKAVTGTDSFAAYGVQRGSVLAGDRVQ